jgi:hypothetical protein
MKHGRGANYFPYPIFYLSNFEPPLSCRLQVTGCKRHDGRRKRQEFNVKLGAPKGTVLSGFKLGACGTRLVTRVAVKFA